MLTHVLSATYSFFSDDPLADDMVLAPRAEELPEIACASRNHVSCEETIESRLLVLLDH